MNMTAEMQREEEELVSLATTILENYPFVHPSEIIPQLLALGEKRDQFWKKWVWPLSRGEVAQFPGYMMLSSAHNFQERVVNSLYLINANNNPERIKAESVYLICCLSDSVYRQATSTKR